MNRYYLVENGEEEDITDLIRDFRDIIGGCLDLESSIKFEKLVEKIIADPEYDEPELSFSEKMESIRAKVKQEIGRISKIANSECLSLCMRSLYDDMSPSGEILIGTSKKGFVIRGKSGAAEDDRREEDDHKEEDDRREEDTGSDRVLTLVYDSDKVHEGIIGLGGQFFNRLIDTFEKRKSLKLTSDEKDPLIQRKVMALCFWNKIRPDLIAKKYDKGVVIDSADVKILSLDDGYCRVYMNLRLYIEGESMQKVIYYSDLVDPFLLEERKDASCFVREVEEDYRKRLEDNKS